MIMEQLLLGGIIIAIVGLVSAVFGSIVGLGGGIIIVPMLLLVCEPLLHVPIDHATAVGVSLTVLIVTALSSTRAYAKKQLVDFRSGFLLFATSGPAAMLGSFLTNALPMKTFQLSFGCFMLAMAALLIARDYMKPLHIKWPVQRTFVDQAGVQHTYGYRVSLLLAVGFCVGLVSGLFGIGGGSLFVPVMVLLFRFPAHLATATSMFVIFLSALTGSSVQIALGNVDWLLVALLVPGAWFGGKLGALIASKMSGKALLWLLRITLLLFAIRFLYI